MSGGGAIVGVDHRGDGERPKFGWNLGVVEHGRDAGLHCGPETLDFAVLTLGVWGGETLENAEFVAGGGCFT